jgi:hypothetical protein
VVAASYKKENLVRTIEDILGLEHLNLNTAMERPMADIFDLGQREWNFEAVPSTVLSKTKLPIPASAYPAHSENWQPTHDAAYWAEKTVGFDFSAPDRIDALRFNRIVWDGLMDAPYPTSRSGDNLRDKQ